MHIRKRPAPAKLAGKRGTGRVMRCNAAKQSRRGNNCTQLNGSFHFRRAKLHANCNRFVGSAK